MANPTIFNIGETSISWNISNLQNQWNSANYSHVYIRINSTSSAPVYAPSTGTSYTSGTGTFSNLSHSTTYTAYGYAVVPGNPNPFDAGSVTFTTASPPQPPSGTPTVNATAVSRGANMSWSSVSGATSYEIYADGGTGAFWKHTTSSLSYTVSLDKEYTNYTLYVTPKNSAGSGSTGSTSVRTLDETAPTLSTFASTEITKTTVKVKATGYDNAPASGNASGINGFYLYQNDVLKATVYHSNGEAFHTFTGLTQNTTYTFKGVAFDVALKTSTSKSITVTTTNRPDNWVWVNAKTSGANFNLTASEWNSFTAKINEFRTYKTLAAYSFTTVSSGTNFQAYMFNQAITAINAMTPPTAPPTSKSTGDVIMASYFITLRDSLNSIV